MIQKVLFSLILLAILFIDIYTYWYYRLVEYNRFKTYVYNIIEKTVICLITMIFFVVLIVYYIINFSSVPVVCFGFAVMLVIYTIYIKNKLETKSDKKYNLSLKNLIYTYRKFVIKKSRSVMQLYMDDKKCNELYTKIIKCDTCDSLLNVNNTFVSNITKRFIDNELVNKVEMFSSLGIILSNYSLLVVYDKKFCWIKYDEIIGMSLGLNGKVSFYPLMFSLVDGRQIVISYELKAKDEIFKLFSRIKSINKNIEIIIEKYNLFGSNDYIKFS